MKFCNKKKKLFSILIIFCISILSLIHAQLVQKFHDTKGNIEVNNGGQLQFTLPIAIPIGVKSIAPQVNLVYTSGSGNSIAGYG